MSNELQKKYGLFTAICMVVGIVIGSGVFFKAQDVLNKTNGDMPLGILAWIIGGAIMIFSVLAFSQMAQKYEKVNGVVDYAEVIVGPKYAYYMGWFVSTIYYPTLTSVLAWVSARYTIVFINSVNPSFTNNIAGPECMTIACFYLIASYTINALSPKLAGKFQNSTTIIKMIPLSLMAFVGIVYGLIHVNKGASAPVLIENFNTSSGNFSLIFGAIVATAFAYEGWIIATSINAEIKNSKKNLPIALVVGSIIIVATYVLYYVGVAGGATVGDLMKLGATTAFKNIFGNVLGNVLNFLIIISCLGTLNGLMLACTRGLYSLAARNNGPAPEVFVQVDKVTNMPSNSSIFGLFLAGFWLLFFYGSNLTTPWFGFFSYDSSELPIITTYTMYLPIFIFYMIKSKDEKPIRRFVVPILAVLGAIFMAFAAIYAHGITPYLAAKENGTFSCPLLAYLIMFAVIMIIGAFFYKKKAEKAE